MNVSEPVLPRAESYDELYRQFRWSLPQAYNMAADVCDRHARRAGRTALIYFDESGRERRLSFDELKRSANALANALEVNGIQRGDRVGILLPQCPETAITHIAAWKMGAVSLPLFTLFGQDAIEYRLADSGAAALVTDSENLPKILAVRARLPELRLLIVTDMRSKGGGADLAFWPAVELGSTRYRNRRTAADDPCLLIYTSGTTGPPKGALHAHRTMIAHMASVEFYHQFLPQQGDLFWSPADWAWIGGLMDHLMPAWFHGIPVLAWRTRRFDPEEAFRMIATYRVRNSFLPPTALKLMRQVPEPKARYDLHMRSMFSGGESLGEELLHWGFETFGTVISEGYGQTECNLVVGNNPAIMDVYPGSMGRPVPGHRVEIVDESGAVLPVGETGHIAFGQPDPIAMLGYWRNKQATQDKHVGDWMLSGDLGRKDDRGYLWFLGRADDVITSAGYRIGPGEVEECLMKHPAVAMAAVIGVPDPIRTEAVKAYVVPAKGFAPSDRLGAEIQDFVRARLSAHEYPRQVAFVDDLPMTATGKIRRTELRQRAGGGRTERRLTIAEKSKAGRTRRGPSGAGARAGRRSVRGWLAAAATGAGVLALVLFLASGAAVLAYRVVDPVHTPLMVLRTLERDDASPARLDWRPLSRISPHLVRAVIASEDAQFCTHNGFDWEAIRKALEELEEDDGRPRGGSTISMQTAKNVFLWPERLYLRKGLEAGFTVLIEALWDKRRIMEVYLNVAEWGPGIYGAEQAARTYFKRPAAQLTPYQAALMASTLPNPLVRRPNQPSRLVRRKAQIIMARMRAVAVKKTDPCPS